MHTPCILFGFLIFYFAVVTISKSPKCIYPRALYNGDCVTCPANTLYQSLGSWDPYHSCVNKCSGATQRISGRKCKETCQEGSENQRGEIRYCRDKYLNIGFCSVNNCPQSTHICYFMQCFLTCPIFTVQYADSCLIECFGDRPFVHDGVCVKECLSEEHVIENGICLSKCSEGRYISGKFCVTSCLENQYIEKNICVSNCSNFTKLEGRHCVHNCSQNRYTFGNKCVTDCPKGFYKDERQCVVACPNNTVIEDSKCLHTCSEGRYLSGSNCLKTCPDGLFMNQTGKICIEQCVNGYIFKNNSFLLCLQSCPSLTVQVNDTCEKECPKIQPFYHEGLCLQACPNSSSFISAVISPFDIMLYTCVRSCPKYVSLNNLCVDTCLPNEVLLGNKCQSECPMSDPVRVHLPVNKRVNINITSTYKIVEPISAFVLCAIECPRNFFLDTDECFMDCLNSSKRMVHNSTCLEKCPDDYPYMIKDGSKFLCSKSCNHLHFRMECIENCPTSHKSEYKGECVNCTEIGMFSQGKECVDECKHFLYDSECYDFCPAKAQFMYNKTCYRTCPDNISMIDNLNFGKKNIYTCVQSCPRFKYILGNRCVLKCPKSKRYNFKGKCISCKDIGKFDDWRKCVDVCPKIGYNFRCYQRCPYNTKLYNKSCVKICPSEMPLPLLDWSKGDYCGNKCPAEYFLLENQCSWYCQSYMNMHKYIYNGTCVDKCPSQAPYIWNFQKYNSFFYRCIEKCEDGKVKLNNNCYNSCPEKYHEFEGNCILHCPEEAPFDYRGRCVENCTHYKLGLSCLDDCPSNLFRDNDTCVVTCPTHRQYNYHRNCVESCKNYIYTIGKNCYNSCPPEKVEFQRQCVDDCPEIASFNNKGLCVSSCPNMTLGKECYDSCPYRMKTYKHECVEKCPDNSRFTNDNECVEYCPLYYNNLECIDKCQENTYPHGKICKPDCPTEAPFQRIGFSSKKCVSSCYTTELAAENMTCMYKHECKGYIDNTWCRKKCPLHTFIFYIDDKKYCRSLNPVYVWTGILVILILANIVFGIRLMVFRTRILKENQNGKKEELEMDEINLLCDEND